MATIAAADLIVKFEYALSHKWGYIWGTAGILWTQAKQDALVAAFVKKYGSNWKNNANAKNEDKYYGATKGSKWVGHTVADCSGLFTWEFNQLGGYMYHGSNTMYNSYCTSKGKLTKKGRADGQVLKPGTAVFTYSTKTKKYGHVGLYVGNDRVIEASGTNAGIITTTISGGKWTYWGELKGVDYGKTTTTTPEPQKTESKKTATVNGTRVALRAAPSTTSGAVLLRVDKGKTVEVLDDTQWTRISYNGKTGYMMTKFLDFNT